MAVRLNQQRDYQVIREIEEGKYETVVYGIRYEMRVFMKEYRGAEYQ